MSLVIRAGDTAHGYLDYFGAEVIGTVQATRNKKAQGQSIAVTGDNVHFPSHQKTLTTSGTADISLIGIGKMKIAGSRVVLSGQVLSNGATLIGSGSKLISS